MIPFADFAPDRSAFDPKACDILENCLPKANSYGPFPSFVALSLALSERPQGACLAFVGNGSYLLFVGTATKLWKFNSATLGWTDISKVGGYSTPSTETWHFTQFGNTLIATNGVDPVQSIDVTTAVIFADLAASAPRARFVTSVGDFVMLSNLSTDRRMTQWSGLNQPTFWTPRQRSSDFQSFPSGSDIMNVVGGMTGALVLQNDSIWECALALDSPLVMTFKQAVSNHGCAAPRSAVQTSQGVFYLSDDGFYKYGAPPIPIGNERVDQYFLDSISRTNIYNVYGSEDPSRKVVYWAYRSTANTLANSYDKVLCYHYALDKWSLLTPQTLMTGLVAAATPGYTLDSLDSLGLTVDTLPYSLDSRAWSGGTPTLAAFDSSYKLGFFTGSPLAARIQTGDVELTRGRRTYVSGFRVLGDAPTISGLVAVKDHAGQARVWKPSATNNRTGLIPARASGRFHRFELNMAAGVVWDDIHGVDPEARPEGQQ